VEKAANGEEDAQQWLMIIGKVALDQVFPTIGWQPVDAITIMGLVRFFVTKTKTFIFNNKKKI
jgi:hypothetical protein